VFQDTGTSLFTEERKVAKTTYRGMPPPNQLFGEVKQFMVKQLVTIIGEAIYLPFIGEAIGGGVK